MAKESKYGNRHAVGRAWTSVDGTVGPDGDENVINIIFVETSEWHENTYEFSFTADEADQLIELLEKCKESLEELDDPE